jgi:hypothetical protein
MITCPSFFKYGLLQPNACRVIAEEDFKSHDTPSFYRSVSNDDNHHENKMFNDSLQVNYDSHERYLFEFFKDMGFSKFQKRYFL